MRVMGACMGCLQKNKSEGDGTMMMFDNEITSGDVGRHVVEGLETTGITDQCLDVTLPEFEIEEEEYNLAISNTKLSLDGISFELKLSCPIEAAVRFFTNKAVQYVKDTDFGQWLKVLTTSNISSILSSVRKLVKVDFYMALGNLEVVFDMIPRLVKRKNEGTLDNNMMNRFSEEARMVRDHANKAFLLVEKTEDKIRAIQLSCLAIMAEAIVIPPADCRFALGQRLQLLFSLTQLRKDMQIMIFGDNSAGILHDKEHRTKRVRDAIAVLVHCEAFAATNNLSPLMYQFIKPTFSVNKILQSGYLGNVEQLKKLWSCKELEILNTMKIEEEPKAVEMLMDMSDVMDECGDADCGYPKFVSSGQLEPEMALRLEDELSSLGLPHCSRARVKGASAKGRKRTNEHKTRKGTY